LAAVPERVLREQPRLRQRIEHHARRLDALDLRDEAIGGLFEIDLRGLEERVLLARLPGCGLDRREVVERDPVEAPAVRRGNRMDLLVRLREADVEPELAVGGPVEEELQRERRLAGARITLNQMNAIAREAAAKDLVEPADTGRYSRCERHVPLLAPGTNGSLACGGNSTRSATLAPGRTAAIGGLSVR
jgi:hypothetical protein